MIFYLAIFPLEHWRFTAGESSGRFSRRRQEMPFSFIDNDSRSGVEAWTDGRNPPGTNVFDRSVFKLPWMGTSDDYGILAYESIIAALYLIPFRNMSMVVHSLGACA